MTQLSLDRALRARDEGMGLVDAHADSEWRHVALGMVYECAAVNRTFTADDVWELIPEYVYTHEPRALGPIMVRAVKEGWIRASGNFQPSKRESRHACPVRVWVSKIHGEGGT